MDLVSADVRQRIFAAFDQLPFISQKDAHCLPTVMKVIMALVGQFGLPHPPAAWYSLAFRSFDNDGDGYVTPQDTLEIFAQYYATHRQSATLEPVSVGKSRASPRFRTLCQDVFRGYDAMNVQISRNQMEQAFEILCHAQGVDIIPSQEWYHLAYDNYAARDGVTIDDLTDIAWQYIEAARQSQPSSAEILQNIHRIALLQNDDTCNTYAASAVALHPVEEKTAEFHVARSYTGTHPPQPPAQRSSSRRRIDLVQQRLFSSPHIGISNDDSPMALYPIPRRCSGNVKSRQSPSPPKPDFSPRQRQHQHPPTPSKSSSQHAHHAKHVSSAEHPWDAAYIRGESERVKPGSNGSARKGMQLVIGDGRTMPSSKPSSQYYDEDEARYTPQSRRRTDAYPPSQERLVWTERKYDQDPRYSKHFRTTERWYQDALLSPERVERVERRYQQEQLSSERVERTDRKFERDPPSPMRVKRAERRYKQESPSPERIERADRRYQQEPPSPMRAVRGERRYQREPLSPERAERAEQRYQQEPLSSERVERSNRSGDRNPASPMRDERSERRYQLEPLSPGRPERAEQRYQQEPLSSERVERSNRSGERNPASPMRDERSERRYQLEPLSPGRPEWTERRYKEDPSSPMHVERVERVSEWEQRAERESGMGYGRYGREESSGEWEHEWRRGRRGRSPTVARREHDGTRPPSDHSPTPVYDWRSTTDHSDYSPAQHVELSKCRERGEQKQGKEVRCAYDGAQTSNALSPKSSPSNRPYALERQDAKDTSSHASMQSRNGLKSLDRSQAQELTEVLLARIKNIGERYGEQIPLDACRAEFMDLVSSLPVLRPPPAEEWVEEAVHIFAKHKDHIQPSVFQEMLAQYCEARTGRPSALRKARRRQSIAVAISSQVMTPAHKGNRQVYDDYEFREKKGEGSFGEVWCVVQKKTELVRACKSVKAQTQDQLGLIETEIDLMKNLDHPNVLKLFEYYYDENKIYLVVEYCKGDSLQKRVHKKCTEMVVKHYIRGILAALAYCHKRNIIHRDIKPENVLLLNEDEMAPVKVIDFGLSDFLERIEKNATVVIDEEKEKRKVWNLFCSRSSSTQPQTRKIMAKAGTPHYMSPEMHRATYNEKADVFACGVILYQMLTGIHPFFVPGVDNAETAREKILSRQITFKPLGKGPQADLCRTLLEYDAKKRPTAKAALSCLWLSDSSKSVTMSHPVYDCLRRFQRHNKMKQAVLRVLAKEIDETSLLHLREQFLKLDTNSDGVITYHELYRAVQNAVGAAVDATELQAIVTSLDADAEGGQGAKINYRDFLAAMLDRTFSPADRHLAGIFARFVAEDDVITRQSLTNSLSHHSATRRSPNNGVEVTTEDLNAIFVNTSTIDFDEFCRMIGG